MTKEFSNGQERKKASLKQLISGVISNEGWLSAEDMCSLVKTTYTQSCDLESANTALEDLTRHSRNETG
jgi:hypothetical protein